MSDDPHVLSGEKLKEYRGLLERLARAEAAKGVAENKGDGQALVAALEEIATLQSKLGAFGSTDPLPNHEI